MSCAPTFAQEEGSFLPPPVAVPPADNAEVTAYLQQSSRLHQQCRLNAAAEALEEAIRLDPDNDFAYYRLAQVRSDQRRDEESLEAYRRAIQLNPARTKIYIGYGIVAEAHGLRDEAIFAAQQSVRLDPDAVFSADILERLLVSPTLVEQEAKLQDLIREEGSVYDYLALASWLLRRFRYVDAESVLNQALQLEFEQAASVYVYLSIALREQARYEEAEAISRQAIAAEFEDEEIYAELGQALHAQGALVEAADALRRGTAQSLVAQHYNALGNVLRDLGQFAEAEVAYREAIRIYTVYADAYDNLGQLLESQGRKAEAEAVYQDSVCLYFF